eukprot:Sspe_Gene.116546::Locus_105906_Transcript_1_1_Confidence_1.000_Length_665::g.116546::m.116546
MADDDDTRVITAVESYDDFVGAQDTMCKALQDAQLSLVMAQRHVDRWEGGIVDSRCLPSEDDEFDAAQRVCITPEGTFHLSAWKEGSDPLAWFTRARQPPPPLVKAQAAFRQALEAACQAATAKVALQEAVRKAAD